MGYPFKITDSTLDVLDALVKQPSPAHGFVIAQAAGRKTGTVYPILMRLTDAGWLESEWEKQHPQEGKPPRRFYRFTNEGRAGAATLLRERRGVATDPR